MANHANKKAKASSASAAQMMIPAFYAFQALYAFSVWYNGLIFEWSVLMWFGMYFYAENKLMTMLLNEMERGLTPGYTLDLFGVLALSQFLTIFSNMLGWLSFAVVPGYLGYQYGGWVMSFCCKSRSGK